MGDEEKKTALHGFKQALEAGGYVHLTIPPLQKDAVINLLEAEGFKVVNQVVDYEVKLICQAQ